MKALRSILDKQSKHFEPGGKLEKLHALWEAQDTILYTPGKVTSGPSHVRDGLDLKRMMFTVVFALVPAIAMALYNTGYQAHLAISQGAAPLDRWQTTAMEAMGLGFDPGSIWACVVHGALYFIPVLVVTFAIGGIWEVLFASVRGHEVNEGFLVTGFLFPLILPATIPLWQAALGISFGVVLGKEVFGGTGMNFLNPALLSRAFLFFAYPAQITGDSVWIAAGTSADGVSGATWLAQAAVSGQDALTAGVSWMDAFLGLVPGSMGETSALACLIGAVVLIASGVGSWRIMAGVTIGTALMALGLNAIGSQTNALFDVTFMWHFVLGGWAFGTVFM
ncbi:MAG: NADH:ubiquinone reductase (Na(+)-transporting) subunit B, partial [Acidobacteriota bacterium]